MDEYLPRIPNIARIETWEGFQEIESKFKPRFDEQWERFEQTPIIMRQP